MLAVVKADTSKKTFVFTEGDTVTRDVTDEYLFNVTASSQDTYLFMDAAGKVERGVVTAGATKVAGPVSNDTYIFKSGTTYTTITAPADKWVNCA